MITTKNIDKTIRHLKRSSAGLRVDNSKRCMSCGKKVKKWLAFVNGFGGLNYYHPECKLKAENPQL
jgi:hypothetical protein